MAQFVYPAIVTNIRLNSDLAAYAIAHPLGAALGVRQYARIENFGRFRQNPETGTMVFVVPDQSNRSIDALIKCWLSAPCAKRGNGMLRLCNLKVIDQKVHDGFARAGYKLVSTANGWQVSQADTKPADKPKAKATVRKAKATTAPKPTPAPAPVTVGDMPALPAPNGTGAAATH